jgi:hypothetical protein
MYIIINDEKTNEFKGFIDVEDYMGFCDEVRINKRLLNLDDYLSQSIETYEFLKGDYDIITNTVLPELDRNCFNIKVFENMKLQLIETQKDYDDEDIEKGHLEHDDKMISFIFTFKEKILYFRKNITEELIRFVWNPKRYNIWKHYDVDVDFDN